MLANLALNDLDHALDRGADFLTYVRYLDDMVVLVPDSERGRRWADCALDRVREEAEAIGVSLNTDKTRVVRIAAPEAKFVFLGFVFRWKRSPRTGRWSAHTAPRPEKVTEVLRSIRDHGSTSSGQTPATHLECGWKPGPDRGPTRARHVGLDGGPSHGSSRTVAAWLVKHAVRVC